MSIATDVSRIKGNITAALAAIADKGVTVPDGATSDGLADLITSIDLGNEEIYSGSITPTSDSISIGIEVSDPLKHTNNDFPLVALFVDTTTFNPGEYITVMGILNGIAFRHVGTIPTKYNNYENYIRGSVSTDEEIAKYICKFYGKKTWFYGHGLPLVLGSTSETTNYRLIKAGRTYHYYIRY